MENLTNPQTRQAKYLCRNILASSRNIFTVENNNSEILYERVCILVLVIRHGSHTFSAPHYIFTCGLPGCTTFFRHFLTKGKIFGKKLT